MSLMSADLPEPATPVTTASRASAMVTSTSVRLFAVAARACMLVALAERLASGTGDFTSLERELRVGEAAHCRAREGQYSAHREHRERRAGASRFAWRGGCAGLRRRKAWRRNGRG